MQNEQLVTEAEMLFTTITIRLNELIQDCRAKADFSLHRAERRKLSRIRVKAYRRWERRFGPATIEGE